MATVYVQAKVNSTDYGTLGSGFASNSFLRLVSFGAYLSDHAHFDIRNVKVGTGGYGSSDLFAPALTSLSDFDGVFGNDGSIVATGGVLSVDASSGDHYGYKNFGANQTSVYVQFDLRVRSGDGDGDYMDVWDNAGQASGDGFAVDGIYNGTGTWTCDGPGGSFGSGPTGDPTWDTVNLHYSFTPPPTITLTPNVGLAGSSDSISGANFTASSALSATFDGSSVSLSGTTTTDGSGSFSGALYTVPALADGTYTVVVTDAASVFASADFTIGTSPDGSTQDTAIDLTPSGTCASMSVTNEGAPTGPSGDDPLVTVYGTAGPWSRQQWWKLTNTSGSEVYARFRIANPNGSPIDYAAAVYLDDPASYQVPLERVRNTDFSFNVGTLATGGGFDTFGVALEAGQTVWLEVAGDDTEGDGDGWDGPLTLTWQLLAATFYDTPNGFFDDPAVTVAAYVADELFPDSCVSPAPGSYCKLGDLHFAYIDMSTHTCPSVYDGPWVAVWPEGGTVTLYPIGPDYAAYGSPLANAPGQVGPAHPLLRTDGETVWLSITVLTESSVQCEEHGDCVDVPFINVPVWVPAVYVWNGSGFTNLGTPPVGGCFSKFDPCLGETISQAFGQMSAAASSADPGVLHVVWSEAGPTELNECAGDSPCGTGCSIKTYEHRVNYAAYSSTNITNGSGNGVQVFGASGGDPFSVTPYVSGATFVTNAFGSTVLFYSQPTGGFDPAFTTGGGAVPAYGATVDMYSLASDGTTSLLQSYDLNDLGSGTVVLGAGDVPLISGTQQYQPAWASVETIFFGVQTTAVAGTPLLSVPADGSAAITQFESIFATLPSETWVDDENVWLNGGGGPTPGHEILGIPSDCPGQQSLYRITAGSTLGPCISAQANRPLEFVYDADSDSFYTLGWNCDSSTYAFAPLNIPVLREYLICTVGDCLTGGSLQVWDRV